MKADELYTRRRQDIAILLDWLALEIGKHEEFARQEGVSRKTVYERIKLIRQVLRERGLEAYL